MLSQLKTFTLVALTAAASCRPSNDFAGARADSVIYSQLLDTLRAGADRAYVVRDFSSPGDSGDARLRLADWVSKQMGGIDRALVLALDSIIPGDVQSAVGPVIGVTWIDQLGSAHRSITPQSPLVEMSRIVFFADSAQALIHGSMICGGLCGHGTYYLFRRDSTGVWHVARSALHVVS